MVYLSLVITFLGLSEFYFIPVLSIHILQPAGVKCGEFSDHLNAITLPVILDTCTFHDILSQEFANASRKPELVR